MPEQVETINMLVSGREESVQVPSKQIQQIIRPPEEPGLDNPEEKLREAVANPIGTPRLSELVKDQFGKPHPRRHGRHFKVSIGVDSWRTPTKHSTLFPPILEELERAGIKDEDIQIVEGCGIHRWGRPEEWTKKWGSELRDRFKDQMFSHTAPPQEYYKLRSPVSFVGYTEHNCPVAINSHMYESDIMITLGKVSMNTNFAYTGGAKMILPGLSAYESIVASHCLPSPEGRYGGGDWRQNVGRRDINEMGDRVGLDFILNIVLGPSGNIVSSAAGHHIAAWETLLPDVDRMYIRRGVEPADILITNASPRAPAPYEAKQRPDSLDPAREGGFATEVVPWAVGGGHKAVKTGGTMVIVHHAPWRRHPIAYYGCPYHEMCEKKTARMKPMSDIEIMEEAYYERRWESPHIALAASVMREKELVLTGEGYDGDPYIEESGFTYIPDPQDAVDYALRKHGPKATVNVAPSGGKGTYVSNEDIRPHEPVPNSTDSL